MNFWGSFPPAPRTILWCIDDIVDNSVSKELVVRNEITKFVMFYRAFRLFLEYQLNSCSERTSSMRRRMRKKGV